VSGKIRIAFRRRPRERQTTGQIYENLAKRIALGMQGISVLQQRQADFYAVWRDDHVSATVSGIKARGQFPADQL
jgi:hypothetical protein